MFHLPINMISNQKNNNFLREVKRESRGYKYSILKYQIQIKETIFGEKTPDYSSQEEYAVLTDDTHSKIFAYMAPRQTSGFFFDELSNQSTQQHTIEVKESIEGTMITVFWNDDTNEWNICSRNGVGCDYSFIRPLNRTDPPNKTFRQMFIDAFDSPDGDQLNELDAVSILNDLSKSHCYTCMLQHPENHIVYSAEAGYGPHLNLVAIYELNAMPPLVSIVSDEFIDGCVRELANPERTQTYLLESKTDEDAGIWKQAHRIFGKQSRGNPLIRSCFVGEIDHLRSNEDVQDFKNRVFEKMTYYWSMPDQILSSDLIFGSNSAYFPPAWILTNTTTGHTCEIANPLYEMAKKLRSFQPNIRFQYLYLRQNGMVDTYLQTFPQYGEIFKTLETEYDNFVTEVYNAYVKFYIMNIRDGGIPKNRFIHAAKIHHNVYRAQPESIRRKMTRQDIECYFASIEPSKMFYYLTTTN